MGKKVDELDPILRFAFQGEDADTDAAEKTVDTAVTNVKADNTAKNLKEDINRFAIGNDDVQPTGGKDAAKKNITVGSTAGNAADNVKEKKSESGHKDIKPILKPADADKKEDSKTADDIKNDSADKLTAKSNAEIDTKAKDINKSADAPNKEDNTKAEDADGIKTDTKADTNAESTADTKADTKAESAADTKADTKAENTDDIKTNNTKTESTDMKTDNTKTENTVDTKAESTADTKADTKAENTDDIKIDNTKNKDTDDSAKNAEVTDSGSNANDTSANLSENINIVHSTNSGQTEEDTADDPDELLFYAFNMLAAKNWIEAENLLDKVISISPATPRAYLGKVMVKNRIDTEQNIANCPEEITNDPDFKKATLYAAPQYQLILQGYNQAIAERIKKEHKSEKALAEKEKLYNEAMALKKNAKDENSFLTAASRFRDISDYKDASKMAAECNKLAQQKFVEKGLKMEKDRYIKAEANAARRTKKKIIRIVTAGFVGAVVLAGGVLVGIDKINNHNFIPVSEEIRQQYSASTIAAGSNFTIAVKNDGTVYSTGCNDNGQCDVEKWTDIVAVDAGDCHTVGLKADGTVVATGSNDDEQCNVSGWRDIAYIAAGNYHTVGLKADGTVVATGRNDRSQSDVSSWSNIMAVAAGDNCTIGIKRDGTVVVAGSSGDKSNKIPKWKNIIQASVGSNVTLGLRDDGTVSAAYYTSPGSTISWRKIVDVAASPDHIIALKSDGTVIAAGKNGSGQCDVEDWENIVSVDAGYKFSIGLRENGTLEVTGNNSDTQLDVDNWFNIKIN